jgi:hypothetical protein
MKVSNRELRRIIREEKVRLRREDTSETRSISGDAGKKSRANRLRRLKEVEYHGGGGAAGEIEPLVDELLGILQTMDPMDRNPEIYRIIDELETLAETGE